MKCLEAAIALCFLVQLGVGGSARLLEPRCLTTRVIEGLYNTAPWMVSISDGRGYICQGTLITSRYVLTAAHCVSNQNRFSVKLGLRNGVFSSSQYAVSDKETHFQFSMYNYTNDIALLRLQEDVIFNGLGFYPNDKQICVEQNNRDICTEDIGGPLVRRITYEREYGFLLLGITSIVKDSCEGNMIFTNVMSYVDWIEYHINPSSGETESEDNNTSPPSPKSTTTEVPQEQPQFLNSDCGEYTSGIHPWSIHIYGNGFMAKGTVITDRFIVTNAHNMPNEPNSLEVDMVDSTGSYEFYVDLVLKHPEYRDGYQNDIALLRLTKPLSSTVKPICLITNPANNKKLKMKTLLLAIALCLLFKQHAARFLEPKCINPSKSIEAKELTVRIHNGDDAEKVPWMAGIYSKGIFICGGTLITSQYVLTAAHCVKSKEKKDLYVTLGVYDRSIYTPPFEVDGTISHHGYNTENHINDIALIRLKHEVAFNDMVRPVCISLDMDKIGRQVETIDNMMAFGWGLTEQNRLSGTLQSLSLDRFNRKNCADKFEKEIDIKQICAGMTDNKGDTCTGDSGGPLVRKFETNKNKTAHVQLGIVSYGDPRCSGIGVYTNVIQYVDWIEYKVGGDYEIDNDQDETITTTHSPPNTEPPITEALITESATFLNNDCGEYDRETFPYRVDIFGPTFTTKGTIIARDFVLTNDKNNLHDFKADTLEVALLNPDGAYEETTVERVQRSNGLVLLYLKYPLTISVKPICVVVDKQLRNDIAGVSLYYANGDKLLERLSSNACASKIGRYIDPNQSEVCVSFPRNDVERYASPGDAFGIWMDMKNDTYKYIFAGMASSFTNGVQVLTDVVANTDWILDTMRIMKATDEDIFS
nr:uncharacterized protein LOC108121377 [Drosophila bipectinata]